MKHQRLCCILVGIMVVSGWLQAQTLTGESERIARELLRNTIAAPTPAPVSISPALPTPRPAEPAAPSPTGRQPTVAEVEQQYLAGKITARQFQKYLRDRKLDPASVRASSSPLNQPAELFQPIRSPKTNAPIVMSGHPTGSETTPVSPVAAEVKPEKPESTGEEASLNEMEKKMDELLRLKAAREQAAQKATAANVSTSPSAAPKTAREQLDDLLKLYISGKISEKDYTAKRAEILAESGANPGKK